MQPIEKDQITGLILAGGQGTRMGQVDKGLQLFRGVPLVLHVLRTLSKQTATVLINANQNLNSYQSFAATVCPDRLPGFAGPLAGIQSGMLQCDTPYLLSAPCDSPLLPMDLASKLATALIKDGSDIAVAVTQEIENGVHIRQSHPVFALMKTSLLPDLNAFLESGDRKIQNWHARLKRSEVLFEDNAAFCNINTLEELRRFEN